MTVYSEILQNDICICNLYTEPLKNPSRLYYKLNVMYFLSSIVVIMGARSFGEVYDNIWKTFKKFKN